MKSSGALAGGIFKLTATIGWTAMLLATSGSLTGCGDDGGGHASEDDGGTPHDDSGEAGTDRDEGDGAGGSGGGGNAGAPGEDDGEPVDLRDSGAGGAGGGGMDAADGGGDMPDGAPTGSGGDDASSGEPVELGSAERLVTRLLGELDLGQVSEEWVANVTKNPLDASRVIAPVVGSSSFMPQAEYSLMYLDRMPRAGFEHPTQFVFAERNAPLVSEEQSFWPTLDGVDLVVADIDLIKLFPPSLLEYSQRLPYPGEGRADYRRRSEQQPIFAIYPDLASDSGEGRLFLYVDPQMAAANRAYVNVFVDVDGDGQWDPGSSEQLLANSPLDVRSAGWTATEAFPILVGESNKFSPESWLRIAINEEPVIGDIDAYCSEDDGLSYGCTDEYYEFDTWSGPDCDSDDDFGGCTGAYTFGPALEKAPLPEFEGADSTFMCEPDGIVIPTLTKALVINMGDTSGRTDNEYLMNKVSALLALHYGDDAVEKLNNPTAETALEAIRILVSGLKCLDEAHIYLTGHGAESTGQLWFRNGWGGITPAQLREAITTSATHCPSPMDYAASEGCRIGGYCNLNLYMTSCYSGHFLQGESSLTLPGLNVLTSASADKPAYVDLEGFTAGEHVGHAFVQGFVDNKADASPYGNGDGVTDPAEAQRYAQAEYDDADGNYPSDPQLWQGADCACQCEANACGNGVLDEGEQCDPASASSSCSTNFECTEACTCACALTAEDCDAGQILNTEACACVPVDHCPPVGAFDLNGLFTVFSDPSNHSCCHNVPVDEDVVLPFNRTDGMFTAPGLPGQDIPPLSGTMINDPVTGCSIEGSGSGSFAGFPNSTCLLQDGVILDGMFSGQVSCTPSGFPNDPPIIFDFDAFVSVP